MTHGITITLCINQSSSYTSRKTRYKLIITATLHNPKAPPHNTLCTQDYSPGVGSFPLLDTVGGLEGLTMGSLWGWLMVLLSHFKCQMVLPSKEMGT